MVMMSLFTGGFLAGKRTYILGFLIFAQAIASYVLGDITLADFITQLPEILGGLGLMTLRAAR